MADSSRLQIHTRLTPSPGAAPERDGAAADKDARVRWKSVPHPNAKRSRFANLRKKYAPGDRLLRDTAVACAILLSILALKNADLPWTKTATEGIARAVTMKIDLDESIGRLYFVRELVPETALVFWNSGSSGAMRAPVEGDIAHPYDSDQPWIVYSCAGGSAVHAARGGEVVAVEKGSSAEYIVVVSHDTGLESVYAYMADVCVQTGDVLLAGDTIGTTAAGEGSQLYFTLLLEGQPADPAEYM